MAPSQDPMKWMIPSVDDIVIAKGCRCFGIFPHIFPDSTQMDSVKWLQLPNELLV